MPANEFHQSDSTQPPQTRKGVFLAITFVLLLLRIIVLMFDKFDLPSILVTRSFVGNGFVSQPLLSEIVLSVLMILILFQKGRITKPMPADIKNGIMNTLWFLSFPVITALCLFTFKQEYYLTFRFNELLFLRWLYFVLTVVAVNELMNINPFHKFPRVLFILLVLILSSVLEDFTFHTDSLTRSFGFISGVGLTQALTIVAFRNTFKRSLWAGVFSTFITGSVVCFFMFGAVSESYLTLLLPAVALLLAAISLHSKSMKPRLISLCAIALVSLFLSFFLPSFFPPEYADALRENRLEEVTYHENVAGIRINYNDTSVHRALTQIAGIVDAANEISSAEFGISPAAKWVTIYGVAEGGFNAVFPDGIKGNLMSQRYINDILDSTFLNNPELSCQFPDPVNAILHEYSHLFGIFPYQKWLTTESEGWATYSATRLSKLIFQKYGAGLWNPPYDYARIADSIDGSLMSGHPLVWSHPQEVGAFKMWSDYEQKAGLQNVFRNRWQYTSRDKYAIYARENNPSVVNDFISSIVGREIFSQVSNLPPRKFDELYRTDDWKILGQLISTSDNRLEQHLAQARTREINVNVPEPEKNPASLEIILVISLIVLSIIGKFTRM